MNDVDLSSLEIGPREFACQNPGCWLIHLTAAGDSACDAA